METIQTKKNGSKAVIAFVLVLIGIFLFICFLPGILYYFFTMRMRDEYIDWNYDSDMGFVDTDDALYSSSAEVIKEDSKIFFIVDEGIDIAGEPRQDWGTIWYFDVSMGENVSTGIENASAVYNGGPKDWVYYSTKDNVDKVFGRSLVDSSKVVEFIAPEHYDSSYQPSISTWMNLFSPSGRYLLVNVQYYNESGGVSIDGATSGYYSFDVLNQTYEYLTLTVGRIQSFRTDSVALFVWGSSSIDSIDLFGDSWNSYSTSEDIGFVSPPQYLTGYVELTSSKIFTLSEADFTSSVYISNNDSTPELVFDENWPDGQIVFEFAVSPDSSKAAFPYLDGLRMFSSGFTDSELIYPLNLRWDYDLQNCFFFDDENVVCERVTQIGAYTEFPMDIVMINTETKQADVISHERVSFLNAD